VVVSADTPIGSGKLVLGGLRRSSAVVDGTGAAPGGETDVSELLSGLHSPTTAFAIAPTCADDATLALIPSRKALSSLFVETVINGPTPVRLMLNRVPNGPKPTPPGLPASASQSTNVPTRDEVKLEHLTSSSCRVELNQEDMSVCNASGTAIVALSRLGVSTGKWYFEVSCSGTADALIGVAS